VKRIILSLKVLAPTGRTPFSGSVAVDLALRLAFILALMAAVGNAGSAAEPPDEDALRQQIKAAFEARTRVPDDYLRENGDTISHPNSGIVRLIPERGLFECVVRGGGSYYSFRRRTHEYGQGSNIQVQGRSFRTGFAGADYGYFLPLGNVPISQLVSSQETPPAWLQPGLHDAWTHMWHYLPPRELKTVREHQRAARGLVIGGGTLADQAQVEDGGSYLLRSIEFGRHDSLVCFQVVGVLPDGSVTLVWRTLKVFDVPSTTGSE